MKCRQAILARNDSLSGPLIPMIFSAALLAGCTESAPTPDVTSATPTGDTISVPHIDGTDGSPPTGPSVDPEAADLAGEAAYPPDDESDDPAGMIVTGVNENGGSMAVSPWLVAIRLFRRESDPSSKEEVSVELTRYAEDFPVSAHIGFFGDPLDTCMIRSRQGQDGFDRTNPPPPGISGGDTVVLNMPSGPWLLLERMLGPDQQLIYRAQNELPGTLPEEATLSIPGAAFPTVAAYPLYEPEPVVRLLPNDSQPVTTESQFSWVPSHQSTHVKIDFMAFDNRGDFQWYPVSCWVRDDGTFELPAAVNEALEPFELQVESLPGLLVRYSRVYSRVDLLDGIVFHQHLEIAE